MQYFREDMVVVAVVSTFELDKLASRKFIFRPRAFCNRSAGLRAGSFPQYSHALTSASHSLYEIRWDEKAGLRRDAIPKLSTRSKRER